MSVSTHTIRPLANQFTAIFNAASNEYQRLTGQSLDSHPFAAQLEACESPEAVSNILRAQTQAFNKDKEGDKKLMTWLDPTIRIMFAFSYSIANLVGVPFPPARGIFIGFVVLFVAARDAVARYIMLVDLLERIHFFLQRLNCYTEVPLTKEFVELLGKIMAQLLLILALSTKEMKQSRIIRLFKRLVGNEDVEDALLRLDRLTRAESLMVAVKGMETMYHLKRNQFRGELRKWLAAPDPSINHNAACETQHRGSTRWFTQGSTFLEWKESASLLWICGNPGAGKTILCSAIIEDIKNMRQARSALIAYFYFDFKDSSKRDLRGLLSSLLFQLGGASDRFQDVLSQLYTDYREGFEQPSNSALARCVESMLGLAGQVPIFLILDALDECPSTTGTPSPREKVLDFVVELFRPNHPNLHVCITSRPEPDIRTVLDPLTSTSHRISLHEERGQREDINNYIRAFVLTDESMQQWRAEDKELVIRTLSKRADGMFRWAFCQLDTLRRCNPSGIRKALYELPTTLGETYERALRGIPKEKRRYARGLFQCLVAAIRPLRVEELAEIFAIEFDPGGAPNLKKGQGDGCPEAVITACSTLITIIDEENSKVVQFSHFSVKEFLTSDRLRASEVGDISHYHIPLDMAHTTLARACLAALLRLDEKEDVQRLEKFPLASYAAHHWVHHAKYEDVASRVQDDMGRLFDPRKPYLSAWTWIRDMDRTWARRSFFPFASHPQPKASPLYYAALCGFSGLAKHLIVTHAEDVNALCGYHRAPLHAALNKGHLDVARVLLRHGADVNRKDRYGKIPFVTAYARRDLEAMRLLLEHGADWDIQYGYFGSLCHDASYRGDAEVVQLLLHHDADANARGNLDWTPLHCAAAYGHPSVAHLLLEYGSDIDSQSIAQDTPLCLACGNGRLDVARVLLGYGADVHIRGSFGQTPFQMAAFRGYTDIVQLLLEYGAEVEELSWQEEDYEHCSIRIV